MTEQVVQNTKQTINEIRNEDAQRAAQTEVIKQRLFNLAGMIYANAIAPQVGAGTEIVANPDITSLCHRSVEAALVYFDVVLGVKMTATVSGEPVKEFKG